MTVLSFPNAPPVDLSDGTLFGNDAGEDELPEILNSYFVDQPAFRQFLDRSQKFRVARSRKGMGKSALLSKLAYDLSLLETPPIIVKITGANLLGVSSPPAGSGFLALQNYWTRVICARINYSLATELGFAFSETGMALVDSAEIAGFKERNIISALLQRIKSSKIPIEISSQAYSNHEELLKRALESHGAREVWLFVDDIDATYVDTPEQQALISTFFSACRAIVRDVKGLYIRTSVRTDVWSNIRKNEDLDKCEQYVTEIHWSSPDLKVILSKKIFSYFERNEKSLNAKRPISYREDSDFILERVFTRRMNWGSGQVPPFRPINILSAGRPRWMAQLCRLAGVEAARNNKNLISKIDINSVMKTYSRLRLSDIYKEHAHQYDGLERLVETFSNSPARYTTNDLLSQIMVGYVNKIGSGSVSPIDGFPYSYPMQIAHFLYKTGFIVARREHEGDFGNADFVRFEERPELLSNTLNPDDGMLWEVHPSYRDALNIGKERRAATGAEKKSKVRRNRPGQGRPNYRSKSGKRPPGSSRPR